MIAFGSTLTQLEHADLIRRLLDLDEAYQFKHNLIQESAYASLLRNDRRSLHRATAQALETTYTDDLDANAALLAKHYAEAGDEENTYRYARRAAEAARRISAYAEALMQYDTATLLAERLQVPTAEFVELHQARGRTLELMGRYDQAKEAYNALYAVGQKRQDVQIELGALLPLATLQTFPNALQNLEAARTADEQALELARASGDAVSETRALWNMVLYSYFSGLPLDSIRYAKQGLEIADRNGLREMRAYFLNDMSRSLAAATNITQARQALEEARSIWIEKQNLPMLADNLASACELSFFAGDFEASEQFHAQAVELCQKINNLWNLTYVESTRLHMIAYQGDFNALRTQARTVRALARASGFVTTGVLATLMESLMLGELGAPARGLELLDAEPTVLSFKMMETLRDGLHARLLILNGDIDAGRRELAAAREHFSTEDITNYGAFFVVLNSIELELATGRLDKGIQETTALISQLRSVHVKYLFPELLFARARVEMSLEQWDAADRDLMEAETLALSVHDRTVHWQILAERAKLEMLRGNSDAVRKARLQAREVVEWIADRAPQEYRATFLARPLAQFVLSDE